MTIAAVLSVSAAAVVSSLSNPSLPRSSYVTTRDGYALEGHVFSSRVTHDILSCTQLCFAQAACLSFNFQTSIRNVSVCQVNDRAHDSEDELQARSRSVYGHWIHVQLSQYVFTSLNGHGPLGPTDASSYNGTALEGLVRLDHGIQRFRVPVSGTYTIEAFGASGGNGTHIDHDSRWRRGGLGARAKGTFHLSHDTELWILIGQQGLPVVAFSTRPGGGGGGTFVALGRETPLIIAGGGGGGGIFEPGFSDGDPGQTSCEGSRYGGEKGGGGLLYNPGNNSTGSGSGILAGSGAGFSGDGDISIIWSQAKSFLTGGEGGTAIEPNGGFGGGGAAVNQGGGGGGYSGGGVVGSSGSGTAGGGGSYNAGWRRESDAGVNRGDGRLVITHVV